jgi:hypothetical protein
MQRDFEHIDDLATTQFSFFSMEDYSAITLNDIVMVDEADECFNQFVTFDGTNNYLNGLYNLVSCEKAFLLTATTPTLMRSLVQHCLGNHTKKEYLSQYQITSNATEPFEMVVYSYSTPET